MLLHMHAAPVKSMHGCLKHAPLPLYFFHSSAQLHYKLKGVVD